MDTQPLQLPSYVDCDFKWDCVHCRSIVNIIKLVEQRVPYRQRANIDTVISLRPATYDRCLEILDAFSGVGADFNTRGSESVVLRMNYNYEVTPLYLAARDGHRPIVQRLLAYGANVNCQATDSAKSRIGGPLHAASANGHLAVVEVLLANKAFVNVADDRGRTPLFYAAESGFIEVVSVLLRANAATEVPPMLDSTQIFTGHCTLIGDSFNNYGMPKRPEEFVRVHGSTKEVSTNSTTALNAVCAGGLLFAYFNMLLAIT